MIYKDFQNLKLSALGLGCMRFPIVEGTENTVDVAAVEKMVDYAMANGINYYDTAWIYHGGESEVIIGNILKKYPRDSFYLATKLPAFKKEETENAPAIFEEQLKKCQVDYFDFYLFHNVSEKNIDAFTSEDLGIFNYLVEQKRAGRIRHLGFSTHGSLKTMRRFLDLYGKELEFCQIQLNYLDWKLQNAQAKVELIQEYGLPVWVMEPVRGGKLAVLEADDTETLKKLRPNATAPEWAFRFLQDIDAVTVVLSGMSNMKQLEENIATFSSSAPLSAQETAALMGICDKMIAKNAVPCTGCSYCTEHCPQNLPIPDLMKLFNENGKPEAASPADCIGCRSCEDHCPQGIAISEVMSEYAQRLK